MARLAAGLPIRVNGRGDFYYDVGLAVASRGGGS